MGTRHESGARGLEDRPPLRVVELGTWLAAPGAAGLMSDMGAEVIKIEPEAGDPGRNFIAALGGDAATTPSFALLNRNKKSVVLDLATEAGMAKLHGLLATADVFITNLRPGSLDRMGLGPDAATARYPRLIYASISGFGLRGPDCDAPAYDVGAFWARSGLMDQLSIPTSHPPSPAGAYGDLMTALSLYAAIVTALLRRERTGLGGLVETSLLRTGAYMVSGDLAVQSAFGRAPRQRDRRECRTPMVNSYLTRDGRWFFLIGVEARRHFPPLCEAIGREDLRDDPRFASSRAIREHATELIALLDAAFAAATLDEWAERFERAGVWWQAMATLGEVLQDPQMIANDAFRPVWNGGRTWPMVTSPFSISRAEKDPAPAPELGEHTGTVLGEDARSATDGQAGIDPGEDECL